MKKQKYDHIFHSFDGDKNLNTYKQLAKNMDSKKNPHQKIHISDSSKLASKKVGLNKRLNRSTELVLEVSKNTTKKELVKHEVKGAIKRGLPIKINNLPGAPKHSKLISTIENYSNFKGYTTTKKEIAKAKRNS